MANDTAPERDELHGAAGASFRPKDGWLDQLTYRVAMLAARSVLRQGKI